MTYKDLLGGKGANLAEMTSVLKLPVPPGFTVSTDACRDYMHAGWPEGLDQEIANHVKKLEKEMGRNLGDPNDPLLVSVRSGAKFSMPGMMDTVLNLGLNDVSVEGLAAEQAAYAFPIVLAIGNGLVELVEKVYVFLGHFRLRGRSEILVGSLPRYDDKSGTIS